MNDDLLKAILAMDSYHRGYTPGIDLENGKSAIGSQIANLTISNESDIDPTEPAVLASFYAIAYTLGSGETIISYRGTDTAADNYAL